MGLDDTNNSDVYDSSDDEYARRVAHGGRGVPPWVSTHPPKRASASRPRVVARMSTGGLPKGYKRKEKENAVAGPSRQPSSARIGENEVYVRDRVRGRTPFPLSRSDVQPGGPAAGPSYQPSPLKRPRGEDRSAGPSKRPRTFDESVVSFSFLYFALLLTCFLV